MLPKVKVTPKGKFSIKMAKVHYYDFVLGFDAYMGSRRYTPKPSCFDAFYELEKLSDAVLTELYIRFNKAVLLNVNNNLILTQAEARAFIYRRQLFTANNKLLGIDLIAMELMKYTL